MRDIKPAIWIPVLAAAAIVAGARFVSVQFRNVPEEFYTARGRGANLAEEVVELSRQSLSRLSQIAEHDQARNFPEALALVGAELTENRKSQELAARLASQLEIMARLLPDIRPQRAREIAAEAVSAEVALVSRLVTYNDQLNDLFVVLQLKFNSRDASGEFDGRVNELVNDINEQAKAINEFNKRFNRAMAEFDTFFK